MSPEDQKLVEIFYEMAATSTITKEQDVVDTEKVAVALVRKMMEQHGISCQCEFCLVGSLIDCEVQTQEFESRRLEPAVAE